MNNDDNLDLLDLDDGTSMDDTLPDAPEFAAPRPKKPWLLLGVGLLVIVLATYIIIRTIGGDSSSSIEVDLDAPVVVVDGADTPNIAVPARAEPEPVVVNAPVAPVAVAPVVVAPVVQPQPAPAPQVQEPAAPVVNEQSVGTPVRVIEDRQAVTFNPDKPVVKKSAPVAAPAKPVAKPAPKKAANKTQSVAKGSWFVQFASFSSRSAAETYQRKIAAEHKSLFAGHQFVILAAVLPNGSTTYRVRVAFTSSNDANGFCRNAKSDGLDCFVAK